MWIPTNRLQMIGGDAELVALHLASSASKYFWALGASRDSAFALESRSISKHANSSVAALRVQSSSLSSTGGSNCSSAARVEVTMAAGVPMLMLPSKNSATPGGASRTLPRE